MRSLFLQSAGGLIVWGVLFSAHAVLAEDALPAPLTLVSAVEKGAVEKGTGPHSEAPYRLRTIERDDDGGDMRSLFSLLDPLLRRSRELVQAEGRQPVLALDSRPSTLDSAEIAPLVRRETIELLPVRTLSVPNPLALLGNPGQWGGRFRAAYGSNFNDGSLLHGNLIIDRGMPLGIDTEFNYREDPRLVLAERRFWNGDFNLVYHLKQIQYVGFRIGVGANWLTDGDHTDVGFNTTYGFDIRLKKPFYATTVVDWGWLGSKQTLHWHISGGLDFGRFELFIGYDFFEVGSRERKNVIAGAGIWF